MWYSNKICQDKYSSNTNQKYWIEIKLFIGWWFLPDPVRCANRRNFPRQIVILQKKLITTCRELFYMHYGFGYLSCVIRFKMFS